MILNIFIWTAMIITGFVTLMLVGLLSLIIAEIILELVDFLHAVERDELGF